jgi:SAM-dependent methyltransferase
MTLTAADRPSTQQAQWFVSWFDSQHYQKLYGHRDAAEASGFVDALIRRLRPRAASTMLDLGCGTGRHSKRLASKGFCVTGIDLAASSIAEAAKSERPGLRFFRRDMRAPFGRNKFDYVFSFFTSFGYFDDATEHLAVVRNIASSLKPGGTLALDYLNSHHAEMCLTREETKVIDGTVYRIARWSTSKHFFKRIVIDDERTGQPLEYCERVAKFTLRDFESMLALHGLGLDAVYGDYHLQRYDAEASPRMILLAHKAERTVKHVSLPRQVLADAAERLGRKAEI